MTSTIRSTYGQPLLDELIGRYPSSLSAVLPLMHLAQQVYGFMSEEAKKEVADILSIDPTHVMSIAGFYTLYFEEEQGTHVLEVCNDLACALRGADQFLEMACNKLGIKNHGTTDDGMFTVHNVMCIGACDRAPVLQCNLKFHEHLDEAKFDALIADLRSGKQGAVSVVDKVIAGKA